MADVDGVGEYRYSTCRFTDPTKMADVDSVGSLSDMEGDCDDMRDSSDDDVSSESDEKEEEEPVRKKLRTQEPEKLSKSKLFKPPTREELNTLKENETLFQSSLFRLQVDELISEVQIKEKTKQLLDTWITNFKSLVSSLNESPKYDITDTSWLNGQNIKVPFVCFPVPSKGMFKFCPPEEITVVGGYPLNISVKSNLVIDVFCQIPKGCFQNSDYLNYLYHYKRTLYSCYLAKMLQNSDLVDELRFQYFCGDRSKPTLVIVPAGKLGKQLSVRILLGPSMSTFKLSRFNPEKNNVRATCFGANDSGTELPTPLYNASILVDVLIKTQNEFLAKTLLSVKGFSEGIILLKVWLHQRQLDRGFEGLNGFIISMMVAHLIQNKKIHPLMSSYQVLRITLLTLAEMDWNSQAISLSPVIGENQPNLAEFQNNFSTVFVDSTGYLNLLSSINSVTIHRLTYEAKLALNFLAGANSFEVMFMSLLPFARTFDYCFRISKLNFVQLVDTTGLKEDLLRNGGNYSVTVTSMLLKLLQEGLGKKVVLIDMERKGSEQWSVSSAAVDWQQDLVFGLLVDPENSNKILDMGPPADSHIAKKYRRFWGTKSELRRFPDGSICEAVLWPGQCMADKRLVCANIIRYVLQKHAAIDFDQITYSGGRLDPLLTIPFSSWPEDWSPYGTGEEIFTKITLALDQLAFQLRKIENFEYSVASTQGISPSFRYTEVFPPLPVTHHGTAKNEKRLGKYFIPVTKSKSSPQWTPALEVLIGLEGGEKWPDDLTMIQFTKSKIYLRLQSLISSQYKLTCIFHLNYLDILKDGFIFRLKVSYKREVTLAKMEKNPDGTLKMRNTESSIELEKRDVHLPKLTSILHGLQMQHNSYSSCCRLAKRWISAQLLIDHVPEIPIELIVAHLYMKPSPFTVPKSPEVGFQRFLGFLSTYDWNLNPLILNFNDELTSEDIAEIQRHFTSLRSTLPAMFIVTPFDRLNSLWTKCLPTRQMLTHVRMLAKAALNVLESQLMESASDIKQIFRPSYKPFDVVIELQPLHVPRRRQAVDILANTVFPKHKKYEQSPDEFLPVVNYDPVQCYLQELKDMYGDFADFFCDNLGGKTIGVLWKKAAFEPQPFKVSKVSCHVVDKLVSLKSNEPQVIPNIPFMIEDFKVLGTGLVRTISTKTEKWTID